MRCRPVSAGLQAQPQAGTLGSRLYGSSALSAPGSYTTPGTVSLSAGFHGGAPGTLAPASLPGSLPGSFPGSFPGSQAPPGPTAFGSPSLYMAHTGVPASAELACNGMRRPCCLALPLFTLSMTTSLQKH